MFSCVCVCLLSERVKSHFSARQNERELRTLLELDDGAYFNERFARAIGILRQANESSASNDARIRRETCTRVALTYEW